MKRRPTELRGPVFAAILGATIATTSCSGAQLSNLLADGGEMVTDGHAGDALNDAPSSETTMDTGAADAGSVPPIHCDTKACVPGSETCCRQGGGSSGTFSCTAVGDCTGLSIPCTSAADCAATGHPGEVCCGSFKKSDTVDEVGCVAPSECKFLQYRVVLCDPDDPEACTGGATCNISVETLPGFNLCIEPSDAGESDGD